MKANRNTLISVETTVKAPMEKVWDYWTLPEHITRWCQASDDWHAPYAENDLRLNGKFTTRMESRDGSSGFDFGGVYTTVIPHRIIEYTMDDGRTARCEFLSHGNQTSITEIFEKEDLNSTSQQRDGWQAILDNFKKYAEIQANKETLHFEITINASPETVYRKMLDKDDWDKWTAIFSPGSRYVGSWDKGSKILFLGEDENGVTGGMVSRIADNIPGKYISIEHNGVIQDGKEIISGNEVMIWAGGHENYTFEEKDGKTLLSVDTDTSADFKKYFSETWPKALEVLKDLCEA